MKLIIDIDEDVYKKIVADKYAIYDKMFYSIKNGIPLDDIRAEINALSDYHWDKGDFDIDVVNGMINEFLDIFDKHIGGGEE